MTGYGLTVVVGTKVERFTATVISVMKNWYPHQDIVLCRLSGLGLERTGILSGMSGSPVFIKDPADGKHKMIGAVAYGWSFSKDPICGVQPIGEMLALKGVPLPGRKQAKAKVIARGGVGLDRQVVRAVLNPRKVSFATLGAPRRRAIRPGRAGLSRLVPLTTPVMV
ncbi:hypothetical protein LCGC14_2332760, partial [marine sediment metagenome]